MLTMSEAAAIVGVKPKDLRQTAKDHWPDKEEPFVRRTATEDGGWTWRVDRDDAEELLARMHPRSGRNPGHGTGPLSRNRPRSLLRRLTRTPLPPLRPPEPDPDADRLVQFRDAYPSHVSMEDAAERFQLPTTEIFRLFNVSGATPRVHRVPAGTVWAVESGEFERVWTQHHRQVESMTKDLVQGQAVR